MRAASPVEPSDLRAYPTATPRAKMSGRLANSAAPGGGEDGGDGQEPVADRAGDAVGAEHVGLAQAQQQGGGGQGRDREHERAAHALQLREPRDALLLACDSAVVAVMRRTPRVDGQVTGVLRCRGGSAPGVSMSTPRCLDQPRSPWWNGAAGVKDHSSAGRSRSGNVSARDGRRPCASGQRGTGGTARGRGWRTVRPRLKYVRVRDYLRSPSSPTSSRSATRSRPSGCLCERFGVSPDDRPAGRRRARRRGPARARAGPRDVRRPGRWTSRCGCVRSARRWPARHGALVARPGRRGGRRRRPTSPTRSTSCRAGTRAPPATGCATPTASPWRSSRRGCPSALAPDALRRRPPGEPVRRAAREPGSRPTGARTRCRARPRSTPERCHARALRPGAPCSGPRAAPSPGRRRACTRGRRYRADRYVCGCRCGPRAARSPRARAPTGGTSQARRLDGARPAATATGRTA